MNGYCEYTNGKCVACGHESTVQGLRRECGTVPTQAPLPAPQRGPGFLEKVKNFTASAAAHVAAGMPMASDAEIIRRHDICLVCEHLQDGACTHCGCPISRVAGYVSKLSWADSECPVGKWGKAPSA